MENLKAIGVRLDPKTIGAVDDFVRNKYFWKRNTVINAILTNLFLIADKGTIYDIVRWNEYAENPDEYEIIFRKKMPHLSK